MDVYHTGGLSTDSVFLAVGFRQTNWQFFQGFRGCICALVIVTKKYCRLYMLGGCLVLRNDSTGEPDYHKVRYFHGQLGLRSAELLYKDSTRVL
jgi:hypothetical protein